MTSKSEARNLVAQLAAHEMGKGAGDGNGVQQSESPTDTAPEAPEPEQPAQEAETPPPAQPEAEQRVPYERFAQVTKQNQQLREMLEQLSQAEPEPPQPVQQQAPQPQPAPDGDNISISKADLEALQQGLAELRLSRKQPGLTPEQSAAARDAMLKFRDLSESEALAYARAKNPQLFQETAAEPQADRLGAAAAHSAVAPGRQKPPLPAEPGVQDYLAAMQQEGSLGARRRLAAEFLKNNLKL